MSGVGAGLGRSGIQGGVANIAPAASRDGGDRTWTEAQVIFPRPDGLVMAALFSRQGKVGNFISGEPVGFQDALREKEKERFMIRVGMPLSLLDSSDQLCACFRGDDIGGNVIGLQSAGFLQGGLPFGRALIGQAVDEIKVEQGDARLADMGDGGGDGGAVVASAQPGEVGRAKRLHPQADAGDTSFAQERSFAGDEAVGVGFHGPLLRLSPRRNLHELLQKGGRERGGGAPAEKDSSGRKGKLLLRPGPLGLKTTEEIPHAIACEPLLRKIAVGAEVSAERNVDVEIFYFRLHVFSWKKDRVGGERGRRGELRPLG